MSTPGKRIDQFLVELANDPTTLDMYPKDPDQVLANSGLTQDQQAVLRTNDFGAIRDAILQESADACLVPIYMMGVWPPPPPPPPPDLN